MTVLSCLLLFLVSCVSATPVVHAPWGQIQGVEDVTRLWSPYHAYYAIPYALPPTGNRRFAKPVPHPGVTDVYNATALGPICMQAASFAGQYFDISNMKEDCLTLDIYTPVLQSGGAPVPVIIYIHGGGFIVGSSSLYNAGAMAAKGVIVVLIQYRLGPFGFLSTGDNASKGNYGLWDQHLAIKWVRENIPAFGGDVDRITIMGESAGSASVAYHALYEGSKGMFRRTFMQSGSVTSSWACNSNPLNTAYELARKVNCYTTDHVAMVHCLKQAPAVALSKASYPLTFGHFSAVTQFDFVPSVDGEFVKQEPRKLLSSSQYLQHVGLGERDAMVSVNSNEGSLLLTQTQVFDNAFNTTYTKDVVNRTVYRQAVIPNYLNFYFGSSSSDMADVVDFEMTFPDKSPIVDLQKVLDTTADPTLVVPTIEYADIHASCNSSGRTFMYLFDHTLSYVPGNLKGLGHGADVVFTFQLQGPYSSNPNVSLFTDLEERISNNMLNFIADFAKSGDPSGAVKPILGSDWPEFTAEEQKYLLFADTMQYKPRPFERRYALWTQLLPKMWEDWQAETKQTRQSHAPLILNLVG